MEGFNWVKEYNKLLETMNTPDSYFSGSKFISVIREFDPYHADYLQFIDHRNANGLSTSRKNYFYDIIMSFKEDIRKKIIDRLYEVADEMKKNAAVADKKIEITEAFEWKDANTPSVGKAYPPIALEKEEGVAKKLQPVSTEIIANPVVFISYSWDDEDHKNWVLNLTKRLFENGVQVILDRYELKPGANMLHFMESAIPKADKVLIIFTPNYKLKAEKRQGGVGYEYSILNIALYNEMVNNTKYIPVLKAGTFQESVPAFMQQFIAVDMTDPNKFEDMFNSLLLSIYDKPVLDKPALGKSPF
jgi:predicted transcriptional regulator